MKPETSCLNTKAIVDFVRDAKPGKLHLLWKPLEGKIPDSENPEAFLSDHNNWISIDVCRRIMEAAKEATSDDMAVYKAAFESTRQKKLGYMERIFVRTFLSPKHGFAKVQKINDKYNRSKRVETVFVGNDRALIRLHWFDNLPLTRDFCLMNKGIYQAMFTVWDLPPAIIEERQCFFEGAPYCEYEFSWQKKSTWRYFFGSRRAKKQIHDSLIEEMEADKDLIKQKYEQVTQLNVELEEKIAYLISLQEAGQAVVSILDEQSLTQTIMNLLTTVIGFKRAILFMVDEKGQRLRLVQVSGVVDDLAQSLEGYEISLDRMSNILVRVAATGRPTFVKDVGKAGLRKENVVLHTFQPKNFAAAPLIARNKVIGVLAGEMPEDREIAVAIENARLYRDLEKSYLSNLQSQKMEAVGNLAGGIAHDFNNILQAVLGNVSLLLFDFDEQSPHFPKLKQIESASERASGLVRQLLTFSRKGESQPRPLDLNSEIKEVNKLIASTIPKMIDIELQLDPELRMIDADPVQVNQILMNLAVNARDAMPEGGELVVGTKNVVLDEQFCRAHSGLRPGGHVMLWVSDTGDGIEENVLDHIFEPFYTTKGPGGGTGLGLSTVYGIVKGHNGHIKCESERGVGTTFKIYLRALIRTEQPLAQENGDEFLSTRGTETILLVDDEAGTREYGKELLQGLIMPGIGGKRCLEEMLKVNPNVRVLITTGYADSNLVGETLRAGARDVLHKPFRAHEMAKMIRRVLNEKSAPDTTAGKRDRALRIVG